MFNVFRYECEYIRTHFALRMRMRMRIIVSFVTNIYGFGHVGNIGQFELER